MAVREVKTLVYTCEKCGTDFVRTNIDKSPLHSAYYYYYGGYGDGERIVKTIELCSACYKAAIQRGYGATSNEAAYIDKVQ